MKDRRGGLPDFDATGRKIAWFFAFLGAIFATVAFVYGRDAGLLADEGVQTQGRVVAFREERHKLEPGESGYTRGAYRTLQVPEVEFVTPDGRRHRLANLTGAFPDDLKVGDPVDLVYLPSDPTVAETLEGGGRDEVLWIFVIFTVACLLPLLFMVVIPALRRKPRRRR